MRRVAILLPALACAVALLTEAVAQPPRGKDRKDKDGGPLVERLMALDKNKDGKLTRDEVTDERLQRLFDRADANKDGEVTRDELEALARRMDADGDEGGPGRKGGKGEGGFGKGKFDGKGKGGFGMFGPPQPGQILPAFMADRLNLTPEQRKQLDAMQKEVDAKLAKILTDEQKERLKSLPRFGPGGPPPGTEKPKEKDRR